MRTNVFNEEKGVAQYGLMTDWGLSFAEVFPHYGEGGKGKVGAHKIDEEHHNQQGVEGDTQNTIIYKLCKDAHAGIELSLIHI